MLQFAISTGKRLPFPSTGQKVDQLRARLESGDVRAEQALVLLCSAQAAHSLRRAMLEGQKRFSPTTTRHFFTPLEALHVSRRKDYLESAHG
jgi:hypothetical protein